MQVILLEKVQNLGELGESVKVKPGYARNFLIPQGKAVIATAENIAEFEARRAELERQEAEALAVDGIHIPRNRKPLDIGIGHCKPFYFIALLRRGERDVLNVASLDKLLQGR